MTDSPNVRTTPRPRAKPEKLPTLAEVIASDTGLLSVVSIPTACSWFGVKKSKMWALLRAGKETPFPVITAPVAKPKPGAQFRQSGQHYVSVLAYISHVSGLSPERLLELGPERIVELARPQTTGVAEAAAA